MSGPSLFDDFFNEEEKDLEFKEIELDKSPSLAEIKEQHSIQDEEKEYHEISENQSQYSYNENEQQENKTEEKTISNTTSESEVENNSFYFEMPSDEESSDLEFSLNFEDENKENAKKEEYTQKLEKENITFTIEESNKSKEEFEIEIVPGNTEYLESSEEKNPENKNTESNQEKIDEKEQNINSVEENNSESNLDSENVEFIEEDFSIFALEEHVENSDSIDKIKEEKKEEVQEYKKELKEENFIKKDLKEQLPQFSLSDEKQPEKYIPKNISESELPKWELQKNYYSISEVANFFNVNISHIRYWTNEFKLKPRTTRRGERLYSPENINKLRMIYFLVKEQGHTIEGAKNKLKQNTQVIAEKIDLKKALLGFKNQLEELLKVI